MTIGERIKECREKLGLSQEEVALKMGYSSRSTINKIEKGLSDVTQSKVIEFAKVLQTTPEYLMGLNYRNNFLDKDIRRIERARKKMPQEEKDKMMAVIKAAFSEYFSDDFDDDVDE